jgi:hypothetical protein
MEYNRIPEINDHKFWAKVPKAYIAENTASYIIVLGGKNVCLHAEGVN